MVMGGWQQSMVYDSPGI